MKKTTTYSNASALDTLATNSKIRREIARQRRELSHESEQLTESNKTVKDKFIRANLSNFIKDMNTGQRDNYVYGQYSSDFTKYVSRNYCNYYSPFGKSSFSYLSDEHRDAVQKFNEAKEKMNLAFVMAILTESGQEKLLSIAGIKNLDK